eukprot:CAMPEP_0114530518 /NCGR_PEP_ID=MMETSP0109-20121206/25494_1 /TAXON_ID=29199 /ORGANISM="Chlorarachnion reptans, Strain CCCM449" /LENGTH=686 /DNA_ID=CAMNT_0001713159 /DNA_START=145 /DNA_END=2205 /DNA_ORIENTATION=-
MPDPINAGNTYISSLSAVGSITGFETPILVRIAAITGLCRWNTIAYQDGTAMADGDEPFEPPFRVPNFGRNAFSRVLSFIQCTETASVLLPYTPVNFLGEQLRFAWGLPITRALKADIAACAPRNNVCLADVASKNGYDPFTVGQIVAKDIFDRFVNGSGWNDLGEMRYSEDLDKAVPCTANCAPFTDTTGFKTQNGPFNNKIKTVGNSWPPKKIEVKKEEKFWQPITENDGKGFFQESSHVVPHIGFKAQVKLRQNIPSASDPNYDYTKEVPLVVERLQNLSRSVDQQRDVQYFDNKLAVRFLFQRSIYVQFNISYETQVGLSQRFVFKAAQPILFSDLPDHVIDIAENDAIISVWKNKIKYNLVRPTTIIKHLGEFEFDSYSGDRSNPGPVRIKAPDFSSYVRVMPHAEYPSASACLCTAYKEGADKFTVEEFGGLGGPLVSQLCSQPGNPFCSIPGDIIVANMAELEQRCSQSRLNGGMHFTAAVNGGREVCTGLGDLAYDHVKNKLVKGSSTFERENGYYSTQDRPQCPTGPPGSGLQPPSNGKPNDTPKLQPSTNKDSNSKTSLEQKDNTIYVLAATAGLLGVIVILLTAILIRKRKITKKNNITLLKTSRRDSPGNSIAHDASLPVSPRMMRNGHSQPGGSIGGDASILACAATLSHAATLSYPARNTATLTMYYAAAET